ncbi:hypothetical protein CEP88_00495 [Roseobacter denitrificans]|uniref:hypothetical protein n=1 Tax=Roseobacter denitrificans TaxID=2434 RepID=UPI00030BA1EC|nr:hypothetical protein [Roseobacter denitrificans]AVL51273.1 hypothetical protein CEP88_00495 [Roseobacter denitrificans]SFF88532.1 hypothetical protein SAMN05443635_103161 [Roseobacter denitrificans OCh 114]
MNWSATEITALASKAARGAGAPPLQAARFGQAAAVHLTAARPPDALAQALDCLPGGPILEYPLALDAALSTARTDGCAVVVSVTQDSLLDSYVAALPFTAHTECMQDGAIRLVVDFAKPRPRNQALRITGCDALVARMSDLAARTFVPESAASRSAGAGAGLTDND